MYGLKQKLLQVLKLLKFNANEQALIGFREILLDFDPALEMLPLFLEFETLVIFMEVCVEKPV
jgi:hypothetical protein